MWLYPSKLQYETFESLMGMNYILNQSMYKEKRKTNEASWFTKQIVSTCKAKIVKGDIIL